MFLLLVLRLFHSNQQFKTNLNKKKTDFPCENLIITVDVNSAESVNFV